VNIEQPRVASRRAISPASLRSVWAPRILLAIILLLGAYFRTLSLTDWDSDTGQHPDERFFSDVASTVRLPGSLSELYDSSRSPLNPRNYDRFPLYVYGPFPVIAARVAAVMLTPAEALPAQAPRINGPPRVGADPANPGERRTDYGPLVANPERVFPRASLLIPLLNPEGRDLTLYGQIQKVGRGLAVLFDLGSIVLVYLIGRRLFDRRVGLLAALLAALTVMQIQQAHFFVDPIFSTFFCLLSLYWALRVAQGGGWSSYAALGLAIGAAMANRITLATLGLAAIVAAVVAAWRWAQGASRAEGAPVAALAWERFLWRELPLLILAGALTLLSFRTLAPDAFTGSTPMSPVLVAEGRPQLAGWLQGAGFLDIRPEPRFVSNISSVRALVSGELDYPPSQQWVGRTPYLFPWVNMVLWGMGPALGLAAWGGAAAFALGGLRRALWPRVASLPLSPAWVLLAWIGFYFGWQGGQFAITLRYLLPIYGALTVFGAWGLVRLADLAREPAPSPSWRALALRGGRWALLLVALATLAWAYAFSRIYTQPHSRVIAARWLADNAPPGAFVMSEIWDDPLPLQAADAAWGATFQGLQSAPYAEDEPRKYFGGAGLSGAYEEGLLDQLDRADYITLTSNRIYDSASRLRMRYPALMRYYHSLFSGELGFRLAAEITSYPRLLGIEISDQGAEEAFHVYDHPRVLIFEKTAAYSRERAEALITGDVLWEEVYKSPVLIADRHPAALRLTDGQWRRYAAGGSWAGYALPPPLAPLTWLLALEALSLATFALLFPLLPRLPDRGFSLAKILALLLVAYLAWLAGSLGNDPGIPGRGNAGAVGWGPFPLPFAPATIWLCAAPLMLAGLAAAWRQRAGLRAFGRARRAALLSAEALFLGFFLLGIVLRLLNPDLWHPARGGEKLMDFAYFNAVLRSAAFPPYDPWHAGGFINYYYFGFVLAGALTHLSGAAPGVAYNLAVATVLGLTALGAWGVVYNLLGGRADAVSAAPGQPGPGRLVPQRLRRRAGGEGSPRVGLLGRDADRAGNGERVSVLHLPLWRSARPYAGHAPQPGPAGAGRGLRARRAAPDGPRRGLCPGDGPPGGGHPRDQHVGLPHLRRPGRPAAGSGGLAGQSRAGGGPGPAGDRRAAAADGSQRQPVLRPLCRQLRHRVFGRGTLARGPRAHPARAGARRTTDDAARGFSALRPLALRHGHRRGAADPAPCRAKGRGGRGRHRRQHRGDRSGAGLAGPDAADPAARRGALAAVAPAARPAGAADPGPLAGRGPGPARAGGGGDGQGRHRAHEHGVQVRVARLDALRPGDRGAAPAAVGRAGGRAASHRARRVGPAGRRGADLPPYGYPGARRRPLGPERAAHPRWNGVYGRGVRATLRRGLFAR